MTWDRSLILVHRRQVLTGAGALGLAALPITACAQQPRAAAPAASSARLIAGTICPVTPAQTEGPFYFDPELVREDITEGKAGVPLRLRLQIVGAARCAPSERARVDVWHCDAAGVYSGYDQERSAGQRWLRGTQLTDGQGIATFRTLYRLVRGAGAAYPREGLAARPPRSDLATLFPRRSVRRGLR